MAKLEEYRRKRRFDRTPEPSGEPQRAADKVQDQPSPAAKRTRLPKPKLPQLEVRPGSQHGDTFVVRSIGPRGCTSISGWRSMGR